MTPHNYFGPETAKFVTIRTWAFGTGSYGYGETLEKSVKDSFSEVFAEHDKTGGTLVSYERTDKTVMHGTGRQLKYLYQVYRQL